MRAAYTTGPFPVPRCPAGAPRTTGGQILYGALQSPPQNSPWSSLKSAPARCEPIPAFPLLPGPSTCPAWPSATSAASRCKPFSPNQLTPASRNSGAGQGTVAAGAREQTASCDAFVLSRRPPAPDAPLKRGISFAKIRGFKVADYNPRRRTRPWNIAVRTRGVFTHRDDFQKPACVERGLVRTGKTLGRPPLACTGITPVIPGSAAPSPYAILRPPSRLCYFEATGPTYAILRPSARPVYALFLKPLRPADAILKIKNICMKTAKLCKYFLYLRLVRYKRK